MNAAAQSPRTPTTGSNLPQPVDAHKGSGIPHGHVPAYLPGSASLVEELDQKVMIVLRDGKHIVGVSMLHSSYTEVF